MIIPTSSNKPEEVKSNKKMNIDTKKRQRTCATKKKVYIDFMSDDEAEMVDFEWDSESWDDSNMSSCEDSGGKRRNVNKKKTRTFPEDGVVGEEGYKRKKINKRREMKKLREFGKSYTTKSGTIVKEKSMKPNPCFLSKKCTNGCRNITEEKRQSLFNHFHSLCLQRKRDWVVAMTTKEPVKRKRSKEAKRRENSFKYYINEGEGRRQVCLRFFIDTLDISQKFLHYTLRNATYGSAQEDQRGKQVPLNKTKDETMNSIRTFIKSLPAVPSHYTRKDSTRLYLPSNMKSIANLYSMYKLRQNEMGKDFVSEKLFRNVFNCEFNLAFHIPKKDKCVKCVAFGDNENPDEITRMNQAKHELDKENSLKRFKFHQELRKTDESVLCVSFDLQKVLNTPMGESMLLFYSRKYAVFNLTFYESVTREAYCFTWGESEGKRGANEVATALTSYIKLLDKRGIAKHLLLYCDSCPGQNKNKIVISALHLALQTCTNINTIQINYLLPGHTHMPVDSVHAVIEKSIKNTIIWAPSQWATVFQLARKSIQPYNVEALTHKDFLNYGMVAEKYFRGNLVGISKIRIVTMKQSVPSKIFVKYNMNDDNECSEEIQVLGCINRQLLHIYDCSLALPKPKYNDLMNLCSKNIIPKIYHKEYEMLRNSNEKEVLIESDEEDVTED
jgi:hypothetical protein